MNSFRFSNGRARWMCAAPGCDSPATHSHHLAYQFGLDEAKVPICWDHHRNITAWETAFARRIGRPPNDPERVTIFCLWMRRCLETDRAYTNRVNPRDEEWKTLNLFNQSIDRTRAPKGNFVYYNQGKPIAAFSTEENLKLFSAAYEITKVSNEATSVTVDFDVEAELEDDLRDTMQYEARYLAASEEHPNQKFKLPW